jgi:calcium-dependent protein kinase
LEINELFGDEIDEAMWKEILLECDTNQDGMVNL